MIAALALAVLAGAASAQSPPPGTVPRLGTPIPDIAPAEPPRVGPAAPPPAAAAPPAAADPALDVTIQVRRVVFEGATAFPGARLAEVAAIPTGPAVPLRAVEAGRAAILALYRDAGFVFTAVDATAERDGTLRLRVGEASITEVRLDGDIGPAGTQVLAFLNNLVGVRPLHIATLERWLLLAQEVPGVSVRAVLRPAGTAPGALGLVAQVGRRAVTGFVAADNRAGRLAGPEQALATIQLNAFTQFGERTEISLFGAADARQLFGQVATEAFLGAQGWRVRLYAGRGATEPGGLLSALGYRGETTVLGVSLSYPWIRRRQETLLFSGFLDALDGEVRLAGDTRLSRDRLRVVRLGLDWARYDGWLGAERPGITTLSLRLSQGLDGLGATPSGSAEQSRQGARTDFTRLAFDLSRTQALFEPWQGATLALRGSIAGQWSGDVLPQSEKFYAGGSRLGRGFFSGEITGDRALAASAELQLSFAADTALSGQALRLDPMLYAFADLARTFENRDSDPDRRVASLGLGARLGIGETAELQVEGVHRLTLRPNGAATEPLSRTALYWRVVARF
jgi:hemolysin activation/secretion protein